MKQPQMISGLRYLPRAAIANGRIGRFEIRVSTDGSTWGTPIATGTWADSDTEKSAAFATVSARYVRLTAVTDAGNRGPWSSAAELNLLGEPDLVPATPTTTPTSLTTTTIASTAPAGTPATLSRTGWTASASDQETAGENGVAANVLDGSAATIWHSRWSPTVAPLPHWITIDMKAVTSVSGLRYLPRASVPNGRIGAYQIHVSADGVAWGTAAASGTWADSSAEKTVTFTARSGRYVRLTATTEAGNRGPWSSVAELNVVGVGGSSTPSTSTATTTTSTATTSTAPPPMSPGSWGPVLNFPLVPVAAALLPNSKLLDLVGVRAGRFGGSNGRTLTAILDPATGVVTQRRSTRPGTTCSAPASRCWPTAGCWSPAATTAPKTSIYDPATDAWTAGPDMNIAARLPGQHHARPTAGVFTIGGSWSGRRRRQHPHKAGEVWSPATGWTRAARALAGADADR